MINDRCELSYWREMEEEGGGEGLIARRMSNKNTALVGKENEINWEGGGEDWIC